MKKIRHNGLHAQHGFTLVSAIFLLVIIAGLGGIAVTLSSSQHRTSAQDVLGVRAYQAARAGLEWGVFQVLQNPGGINCNSTGGSNPVTMPALATTLNSFAVNVNCTRFDPVDEGGGTTTMFQLTSTATTGTTVGAANYIERQITMTIAN